MGYYVRYFGGDWGGALQLGLLFVALVLLMMLALSGSMRARLRVFLGKHFFRYRYDYREEWLRFTQMLSARARRRRWASRWSAAWPTCWKARPAACGCAPRARRRSARPRAGTWRRCADQGRHRLALLPVPGRAAAGSSTWRSTALSRGATASSDLPAWLLDCAQAWLVVPLMVGDELIGFVVLASARTIVEVNWEVNDLLKTAGRQAASFLAQMQATEALLEARKFDAFNRMSAFVVHDLKNIVTQLSLMMKNAKRLHDNPEFQQDMLMTVENSLDRCAS